MKICKTYFDYATSETNNLQSTAYGNNVLAHEQWKIIQYGVNHPSALIKNLWQKMFQISKIFYDYEKECRTMPYAHAIAMILKLLTNPVRLRCCFC